jgi:Ala-tRNA(Pro) deacylase
MDVYKNIVKLLNEHKVPFQLLAHESVYTSEEAARVRGLDQSMGAKSLLLKADSDYVLAVLPGSERLDSKKLREILGTKQLRFATPEEVKDMMGCEIGACYPFGNIINIKMIVDQKLAQNEFIAFNPGLHHQTIKLKWKDYVRMVEPKLVDIIK